jgi:hypothetical protein
MLVTHAKMIAMLLLFGARCGYMPPQLKTNKAYETFKTSDNWIDTLLNHSI